MAAALGFFGEPLEDSSSDPRSGPLVRPYRRYPSGRSRRPRRRAGRSPWPRPASPCRVRDRLTLSFRRPAQPGMTSPRWGSASNSRCMAARPSSDRYALTHSVNPANSMKIFLILTDRAISHDADVPARVSRRRGSPTAQLLHPLLLRDALDLFIGRRRGFRAEHAEEVARVFRPFGSPCVRAEAARSVSAPRKAEVRSLTRRSGLLAEPAACRESRSRHQGDLLGRRPRVDLFPKTTLISVIGGLLIVPSSPRPTAGT